MLRRRAGSGAARRATRTMALGARSSTSRRPDSRAGWRRRLTRLACASAARRTARRRRRLSESRWRYSGAAAYPQRGLRRRCWHVNVRDRAVERRRGGGCCWQRARRLRKMRARARYQRRQGWSRCAPTPLHAARVPRRVRGACQRDRGCGLRRTFGSARGGRAAAGGGGGRRARHRPGSTYSSGARSTLRRGACATEQPCPPPRALGSLPVTRWSLTRRRLRRRVPVTRAGSTSCGLARTPLCPSARALLTLSGAAGRRVAGRRSSSEPTRRRRRRRGGTCTSAPCSAADASGSSCAAGARLR